MNFSMYKRIFPNPIKQMWRKIRSLIAPTYVKHLSEYLYWKKEWEKNGNRFDNSYYPGIMLAMAEEKDASFLRNKIVADFGCGPMESLWWAKPARIRIGIDVLVDQYTEFDIINHDMCYVTSSEKQIPLPSNYVDFLFTLNAIDHVQKFEVMCREIIRVIAPGGEFIGSFNLEEPFDVTEPQTLTEERIKQSLLDHMELISYRVAPQADVGGGHSYRYFFEDGPPITKGSRKYVWARAKKRPNFRDS